MGPNFQLDFWEISKSCSHKCHYHYHYHNVIIFGKSQLAMFGKFSEYSSSWMSVCPAVRKCMRIFHITQVSDPAGTWVIAILIIIIFLILIICSHFNNFSLQSKHSCWAFGKARGIHQDWLYIHNKWKENDWGYPS